jgi:hypothetical protein
MAKPKKDIAAQASAIIAKLDEPEEELSILEVQNLMEERDRAAQPIKPVPVAEYLEAALPVVPGLHALDSAPVNSKIVVVEQGAVLATPSDGPVLLPKTDRAHKLPEGAKITKTHAGFRAEQLSAVIDRPVMLYATAGEAIDGFLAHFHV